MRHEKLIHMANQIATFCRSNPNGARHTADVADHINKYWDPRMRLHLIEAISAGTVGDIHPLVREALPDIRRPADSDGAGRIDGSVSSPDPGRG